MNSIAHGHRYLTIATAGHVDHGKTSLVRHLTGTDTDTLSEEKSRGLTINTGFAYRHFFTTSGEEATLGFVDVPGHSDFINNMLAGVGAVKNALLVVAADDGIMPQTREHLSILTLLGIEHVIIAITKCDRCPPNRVEQVTADIRSLFAKNHLPDATTFTIDNLSGTGVPQLAAHLESLALSETTPTQDHDTLEQRPRFLIDRSFVAKGIGTVITGTVVAGQFVQGDTLFHSSSGKEIKIRGIRVDKHDRQRIDAGQRAALNVNLGHEYFKRGDCLGAEMEQQQRLDTQLRLLDKKITLKSGVDYHFHLGTAHRLARVRLLDEKENLYQLILDEPLCTYWGDRFILRDPAARHTLGGGRVIDTDIPKRGRASSERLEALHAHCAEAVTSLSRLSKINSMGVDLAHFARNRNLNDRAIESLLESIPSGITQIKREGEPWPLLIDSGIVQQQRLSLLKSITSFHAEHPEEIGISTTALHKTIVGKAHPAIFNFLIGDLIKNGAIRRSGNQLALPTHRVKASKEREEFDANIAPLLRAGGLTPPRTREIVEATGIPLKAVERILQSCAKAGITIKVADNRYYLPATLSTLAEYAQQLMSKSEGQGFTVIEFRDATQMGRNLCIEVLEHFDAVGFTLRRDNSRLVRRDWSPQ